LSGSLGANVSAFTLPRTLKRYRTLSIASVTNSIDPKESYRAEAVRDEG